MPAYVVPFLGMPTESMLASVDIERGAIAESELLKQLFWHSTHGIMPTMIRSRTIYAK
jgi:hypothetical protein